jgi:mono/diheme cytochrome c family protein
MNIRCGYARRGILLLCACYLQLGSAQIPSETAPGYYTREQALRGRNEFLAHCASCHADNLAGIGPAPPLAGAAFQSQWANSSVRDLFDRVRTTMPQNAPGSLSAENYADLIAYILRANNFPPGLSELPHDSNQLQNLTMSGGRP